MGQRQVDLPESPSDLHSEFEGSQDCIVRFISKQTFEKVLFIPGWSGMCSLAEMTSFLTLLSAGMTYVYHICLYEVRRIGSGASCMLNQTATN